MSVFIYLIVDGPLLWSVSGTMSGTMVVLWWSIFFRWIVVVIMSRDMLYIIAFACVAVTLYHPVVLSILCAVVT